MQGNPDNIFTLVAIATTGALCMLTAFIIIYGRNQNRLAQQRQDLQKKEIAHQKELLQTVIVSQEKERKRIGQDLHDDVGTAVSSLRLSMDMYEPAVPDQKFNDFISSTKGLIDVLMVDVRNISHNLSPATLSLYGLSVAVGELCSKINKTGKLSVIFTNDLQKFDEHFDENSSVAIYRVIEELLNNTIRHSKAAIADVIFDKSENLIKIMYRDDGIGMDWEDVRSGMGLQNIESRLLSIDAFFNVATAIGKGFGLEIFIPNIDEKNRRSIS